MSPVYEIMIDFVGPESWTKNPELYASIQKNPKAAAVRQTLCAECMRLSENSGCRGFGRLQADHAGCGSALRREHEALERSTE